MEKTYTLTLNKYQRDNLLWLVSLIFGEPIAPFALANTGDWIGELAWMLKPDGHFPLLNEGDRPNISREEMRRRLAYWLEGQRP